MRTAAFHDRTGGFAPFGDAQQLRFAVPVGGMRCRQTPAAGRESLAA